MCLLSPLVVLWKQVRVLRKCPELAEDFVDRVVALLVERSHGVLLCGVQVRAATAPEPCLYSQHTF